MQAQKDPALPQTLFILDNNVARPDGGFGTRYPWFALIGVNPLPSPTNTDALGVVDVGYEYDYNSNAPSDVLNPVAAVNSLVAYLYRHLNQNELDLPVKPDGSPDITCGTANTCGITDTGAVLGCPDAQCGTVPVADRVADLTEPLLTEIVNSAYPNGNPIPADPSKYQPATPFSSVAQLAATAAKIPSAIQQGLAAATGSAPKTTSTTEFTAATKATLTKKLAKSDDESKPLTNVVRDSEKAVPQSVGGGITPTSHPDPVATVDKPTTGEQQETTQEEPSPSGATSGQQSASSGADVKAGKP
jgi:PE-PPE domain